MYHWSSVTIQHTMHEYWMCLVMQYSGINLSNKSAEGSASISTQSLPENGLLFIKEPKNPGKFILSPAVRIQVVHYLELMRTNKRDRTPKKKGAEQSYWVKPHKEKDEFIPRAYCDEQNETNLLPRVFTHRCALIAESCTKEGTSVRE